MRSAELIVLNADIRTLDPRRPRARALAVAGGQRAGRTVAILNRNAAFDEMNGLVEVIIPVELPSRAIPDDGAGSLVLAL